MPGTRIKAINHPKYANVLKEQNNYLLAQVIENVCIGKRQKNLIMTKVDAMIGYFSTRQDLLKALQNFLGSYEYLRKT